MRLYVSLLGLGMVLTTTQISPVTDTSEWYLAESAVSAIQQS
jgi:hypothetical protein